MRARVVGVGVALLVAISVFPVQARSPVHGLLPALDIAPLTAAPPPLALRRLEDRRVVALNDLRGRPVLVYFWASW